MDPGVALLERLNGDVVLSPYGLTRALDTGPLDVDGWCSEKTHGIIRRIVE